MRRASHTSRERGPLLARARPPASRRQKPRSFGLGPGGFVPLGGTAGGGVGATAAAVSADFVVAGVVWGATPTSGR